LVDLAAKHWVPAVVAAMLLTLLSARTWGANSVVIESRTASTGATGVTVGISISNDVTLAGILLPLEIREVDPGSFIASPLTLTVQGRVAASGLMSATATDYFPAPAPSNTCSGPISHTFATTGILDYMSPDGVRWYGIVMIGSCLGIGTDGATPSILLSFSVTSSLGDFEIDTCCTAPNSHLLFSDCSAQVFTPSLTKGVVTIVPAVAGYRTLRRSVNSGGLTASSTGYRKRGTIGQFAVRHTSSANYNLDPGYWSTVMAARGACSCPYRGDLNSDGVPDVFDIIYLIDYVFSSGPQPPIDPTCPQIDRGDVDCNGVDDVFDVVHMIDYVFSAGKAPCDPCLCHPYPTNCP